MEFVVWGYWDKKEFIAFQPVDERIAYQSKDSLSLLILAKKKEGKIQLKLSYNLSIKKTYILSAT